MNTDEVLALQVLKFKQLNTQGHSFEGDLVQMVLDGVPEEQKKLRNICAFISPALFEKVNGLCEILSLSKRQFVELALSDLVEKASATIQRFDALPEGK